MALSRDKFVSINYLNCAGFTDNPEEYDALNGFIGQHPINMIQWRNLNFDPIRYWKAMGTLVVSGKPMGMRRVYDNVRKSYPELKHGYFNPPKEKF